MEFHRIGNSPVYWWVMLGVAVVLGALLAAQGTWLAFVGMLLLAFAAVVNLLRVGRNGTPTHKP